MGDPYERTPDVYVFFHAPDLPGLPGLGDNGEQARRAEILTLTGAGIV